MIRVAKTDFASIRKISLAMAIAVAGLAGSAVAQDTLTPPQAFAQAKTLSDAGDYAQAFATLKESGALTSKGLTAAQLQEAMRTARYALEPITSAGLATRLLKKSPNATPELLFECAQAAADAGKSSQAIVRYRDYLSKGKDAAQREAAGTYMLANGANVESYELLKSIFGENSPALVKLRIAYIQSLVFTNEMAAALTESKAVFQGEASDTEKQALFAFLMAQREKFKSVSQRAQLFTTVLSATGLREQEKNQIPSVAGMAMENTDPGPVMQLMLDHMKEHEGKVPARYWQVMNGFDRIKDKAAAQRMAGEYLGIYESYLQGSKTAKDGPEIAVAFLQSMSSSRETFLPLVSDTKAIQLLQGYADLCNANGRFLTHHQVSGVLSVFVAAKDRDPKKAVQFLVKNSKSNNSAELVRQALTWAGAEANVSQTLSSLTGGRAGLEIESLVQALEPLQQYKQKALLTQALEYSLIFSSPEEKFGALIGRYATAGDSLLTPTEFSIMALNAAKKVGASTQLKALAKGLAADEKFKADPAYIAFNTYVSGAHLGSDKLLSMAHTLDAKHTPDAQMKMLDAALETSFKVPNYASEAKSIQQYAKTLLVYKLCQRGQDQKRNEQVAMKLLKADCLDPRYAGGFFQRFAQQFARLRRSDNTMPFRALISQEYLRAMANGYVPGIQDHAVGQMVIPKGSEAAFMKQAPKMGESAWRVLENSSSQPTPESALTPESWVTVVKSLIEQKIKIPQDGRVIVNHMSRMIAEKKGTFDPAFVDQVFKTFPDNWRAKVMIYAAVNPAGLAAWTTQAVDQILAMPSPVDRMANLEQLAGTGEVQRDPKARAVIDAGVARGYQLKGDEWQDVVLIETHVFKEEKKEKKYVAPFTEFVLAEAILRGAKMRNIHSESPLISSLEGAMERNATTPSLKSAQDVLQLTAAITRLMERAEDLARLKANFEPLEKMMEEYDAPELLYVSIQQALQDGTKSRRADVIKALQMSAIRLAGNIDSVIPVPKTDPAYPLFLASVQLEKRNVEEAWKQTKPLLKSLAENWDVVPPKYLTWAMNQMRKEKQFDAVMELAMTILLKESDLDTETAADVLLLKGDIYRDQQNFPAAQSDYSSIRSNKRYATSSAYETAQVRLIQLLVETSSYGPAAVLLERMVESPDIGRQAEAYYLLALVAYRQENFEEVMENLKACFARESNHPEAHLLEGELRLAENRLDPVILFGKPGKQRVLTPGLPLRLRLSDPNLAVAGGGQIIPVIVTTSGGDSEKMSLVANTDDPTSFNASLASALGEAEPGNSRLDLMGSDTITYVIEAEYQKSRNQDFPPATLTIAADAKLISSAGSILTGEELERYNDYRKARQKMGEVQAWEKEDRDHIVRPGSGINMQVTDADRDQSNEPDTVSVMATTSSGDVVDAFVLTETGNHTGIFEGRLETSLSFPVVTASDTEEGVDPHAIINSTKNTPWKSDVAKKGDRWINVDTMSSSVFDTVTLNSPDLGGIGKIAMTGELDQDARILGFMPTVALGDIAGRYLMPDSSADDRIFETAAIEYAFRKSQGIKWRRGNHQGYHDQIVEVRIQVAIAVDAPQEFSFAIKGEKAATAELLVDGEQIELLPQSGETTGMRVYAPTKLTQGVHQIRYRFTANPRENDLPGTKYQELGSMGDKGFEPLAADLYSIKKHPELAAAIQWPATMSVEGEVLTAKLNSEMRLRKLGFAFHGISKGQIQVESISAVDTKQNKVLPVTEDVSTGRTNQILEIGSGDKIQVSYEDDVRLSEKNPKLTADLLSQFYNATAHLLYEEITTDWQGTLQVKHLVAARVKKGDNIVVLVNDYDRDVTPARDTIKVLITTLGGEKLEMTAQESGNAGDAAGKGANHSGRFTLVLRLGDVTGGDEATGYTLKVNPDDEITVEYLDSENSLPGIPIERTGTIKVSSSDSIAIVVSPTRSEPVPDTSPTGVSAVKRFARQGLENPVVYRDAYDSFAAVSAAEGSPVMIDSSGVLLFSVEYPKGAVHGASRYTAYVVSDSEIAAAKRDKRKARVVSVPLRLSDGASGSGKGYPTRIVTKTGAKGSPLETGRFSGIVRLQKANNNAPFDNVIVKQMGEFAVRKESVSLKDEMGIWASTFLASVIVNGADTVRIIVRENDGSGSHENEEKKVIARGEVKLRSDASLRMMDRTYRVDRNKVYLGQKLYLQVNDTDADISEGQDEVTVQLAGPRQTVSVTLLETYPHSGLFRGSIRPVLPAEKIQKAKEKKVEETIVIEEDTDTLNTKSTLGDDDGLEDDDDLAVEATKEDTLEVDLGDALKLTYTDTTPLSSWGLDKEGVRVKLPLDGSVASEAQELTVEGAIHMGGDALMVAFTKRFEDDQVAVKTRFLMAEALFEIAKEQRKIGRKEAATESIARGKRVLTEALRDYPDTAQAVQGQYLLANLSQELGQYIEAIGMYKGVIIHWPKASYASKSQLKLAICYEKMKNYDQASEEYVRLIYRYPKSPLVADATVRMAQQYYVRKEYQVAGDIFVRFQANFPEHKLAAKALFLAAQCQMKNTDFAKAATIFTQLTTEYTEDKPLRAKSMYWAGDCYYQAGDFLQAYRRWTQLTWDYPESNWAKVARGKLTDEVMSGMKMAD